MKVRKAVFPVAGLGTRFLPATKANPKEMLPIVDKPLIQYAVEEAIDAGISELIFVTSSSKRAIEDHFDSNYELESRLAEGGKHEILKVVQEILPPHVSVAYIRQANPAGLGHAVLCAKPLVCGEPFALLLADDLIDAPTNNSCLKQMVDLYERESNPVLAVEKVADEHVDRYGIVDTLEQDMGVGVMKGIIEKPSLDDAPSRLGVVGRYILPARIFQFLETTQPGQGGEIQITDAIAELLQHEKVNTLEFEGRRFDCGSKLDYLEAMIAYALKHDKLSSKFKTILKKYQGE